MKDIIISYPYILLSNTIKTTIFYLFTIMTNRDSIIVFEEPEAHAFPYYTKYLAERIASDKTNQFFIVTHSPYFLSSILEKAPKDEINLFVTSYEKYQTKIKKIQDKKISELLNFDVDPFFNLNSFCKF